MEMAKAKVAEIMTSEKASICEGSGLRFYSKPTKGRLTTDLKKLQADNPSVNLQDYQKRGNDFMTLRAFEIREAQK